MGYVLYGIKDFTNVLAQRLFRKDVICILMKEDTSKSSGSGSLEHK